MRRPTAVLFDVGGVLILPNGQVMSEHLAERLDLCVDGDRCRDAVFRAGFDAVNTDDPPAFWRQSERMARAWAQHAGIPAELAEAAWECLMRADVEDTPLWDELNPQAPAVLAELRSAGYRLGVVSNADGRLADDLARHGLREFFEVLIDSSVVGVSKPDPRVIELALTAMRLSPLDVWFLGDDYYFDIGCARRARIAGRVLFDRLDLYPDSADYQRVRKLSDLFGLLRPDGLARSDG